MVVCGYKENFMEKIGIVGYGVYLPKHRMTAKEISEATEGVWATDAITNKLGIVEKVIPGPEDGTQEMGVKAALAALDSCEVKAEDIDLILCMGEEWKEYPLTTSALYIQGKIGAVNAWGIDVQNRCSTTVSALKMAKDMLIADEDIRTVMVVGGYRNGDFVNYKDPQMSMMYNLSAGGGALILQKGASINEVLGSHIMADGTMARDAGVEIGGMANPITKDNIREAATSLRLMRAKEMKERLNEVSMDNWMHCIDRALKKSSLTRKDIDYVAVLHIKRSMHSFMLEQLGVSEDQSIYLENYGHMGQVDQILSLDLGVKEGKIKEGDNVLMIAAGIGYVWSAAVVRWGKI